MTDTKTRLIQIVADQLNLDLEHVLEDSSFTDDLGADSLGMVELIMEIEEAFNVEIYDDAAMKIKTVGDAIAAIDQILSKSALAAREVQP